MLWMRNPLTPPLSPSTRCAPPSLGELWEKERTPGVGEKKNGILTAGGGGQTDGRTESRASNEKRERRKNLLWR